MLFLTPNQQCQSTEGNCCLLLAHTFLVHHWTLHGRDSAPFMLLSSCCHLTPINSKNQSHSGRSDWFLQTCRWVRDLRSHHVQNILVIYLWKGLLLRCRVPRRPVIGWWGERGHVWGRNSWTDWGAIWEQVCVPQGTTWWCILAPPG